MVKSRRSQRSRRARKSKVRIPIGKEKIIENYSLKSSADKRRQAVRKAVSKLGKTTVIRRLNALSIVHKNTNVMYSNRAHADMKYVQEL